MIFFVFFCLGLIKQPFRTQNKDIFSPIPKTKKFPKCRLEIPLELPKSNITLAQNKQKKRCWSLNYNFIYKKENKGIILNELDMFHWNRCVAWQMYTKFGMIWTYSDKVTLQTRKSRCRRRHQWQRHRRRRHRWRK